LNPNHALVARLRDWHAAKADDPRVANVARLLLDQALVAEGSRIDDPVGFASRINEFVLAANGG
jgi:molecular chaperone HtpG